MRHVYAAVRSVIRIRKTAAIPICLFHYLTILVVGIGEQVLTIPADRQHSIGFVVGIIFHVMIAVRYSTSLPFSSYE